MFPSLLFKKFILLNLFGNKEVQKFCLTTSIPFVVSNQH